MDQVTHVLDTHAVVWAYMESEELGPAARQVIERAPARTLAVSDFTLLEVAMLVRKGRLQLGMELLEVLRRVESDFVVLPLGSGEATAAVELPLEQADPFDRVIVAAARLRQLPLLTRDRRITESGLVTVVW